MYFIGNAWGVKSFRARERAARGFGRGGGNGFCRRITETDQSASGFLFILAAEIGQRCPQCFHAEVILAIGPLNPVEERGQINHLAARFKEVEVHYLLSRHALHWA